MPYSTLVREGKVNFSITTCKSDCIIRVLFQHGGGGYSDNFTHTRARAHTHTHTHTQRVILSLSLSFSLSLYLSLSLSLSLSLWHTVCLSDARLSICRLSHFHCRLCMLICAFVVLTCDSYSIINMNSPAEIKISMLNIFIKGMSAVSHDE